MKHQTLRILIELDAPQDADTEATLREAAEREGYSVRLYREEVVREFEAQK